MISNQFNRWSISLFLLCCAVVCRKLADPRWLHAQTTCAYRCIDLKRCYMYMYARHSQPVYTR